MTQAQDKKKNNAPVLAFSFVQAGFWMSFCKGLVEIPVMFIYVRFFKDGRHALALRIAAVSFVLKNLGGMLASFIGGQLYDHMSVTSTLWAAFAVGLAGAVIVFAGTRKTENNIA